MNSLKRSSPRPSKSTDRMFVPCPSRKPPLIDLCEKSPPCSKISIRVSDVTKNSEKSGDDEGIIDLEDDDDYSMDILDELIITDDDEDAVETLSDMIDSMESAESDDDVIVTGEILPEMRNGDSIPIPNGEVYSIPDDDDSSMSGDRISPMAGGKASSLPQQISPSSAALAEKINCECRALLKMYPDTGPSGAAEIDSYLAASISAPLAPGGKSLLSPVARARLICGSSPSALRYPHATAEASPLAKAWSPATAAVMQRSSAELQPSPQRLGENLKVPQRVTWVPNSEIDVETVKKYQLKNFTIHLSKKTNAEAIQELKKANFLSYFNIVERSKLPPGRVKPLVIKGLNRSRFPYVLKKQIAQKRRRKPLTAPSKRFECSGASPTRNHPAQVVFS